VSDELGTPPTELEVAALLNASREGLSPAGLMVLRRLAFDRDRLAAEAERLTEARRIMVERLWFPRFCGSRDGVQRWAAYSWHGLSDLRDTTAVVVSVGYSRPELVFDDPIAALIESERWYRENVELAARPPAA